MIYVQVPVPRLSAGLLSNLVGLLGLIALVAAPGALTGDWAWCLVTGGVAGVALSYLISAQDTKPADREIDTGRHLAGRNLKAAK